MTDETIQNLQETLAHQEQQISDLSEMLISQGREIDALKKELMKLQGKFDNFGTTPQADQKPPHY